MSNWFTNKSVEIVAYKINRRPFAQPELFQPEDPAFPDHLVEALLYGEMIRISNIGNRQWQLGNRQIRSDGAAMSGIVGWQSVDLEEEDHFDQERTAWVTDLVPRRHVTVSPFAIDFGTQYLYVVRHSSFGESAIATVFSDLLQRGEQAREAGATVNWEVQPLLDENEFEEWLESITSLDRLQFVAKLPNPDGQEQMEEALRLLEDVDATELRLSVRSTVENGGLSRDLGQIATYAALLRMCQRGYASVTAWGRDLYGAVKHYQQSRQVRRERRTISSDDLDAARDELSGMLEDLDFGVYDGD